MGISELHIFKLWKVIESLTPQKADKANPRHPDAPIYHVKDNNLFPWHNLNHLKKRINKGYRWQYKLQCIIYDVNEVARRIEGKIGTHEDVYSEYSAENSSRFFDLELDPEGYPIPESFVLSLACWTAGQILYHDNGLEILEIGGDSRLTGTEAERGVLPSVRPSGYKEFDVLNQHLICLLHEKLSSLKGYPDKKWLDEFSRIVIEKCFLPFNIVGEISYIVKCQQVKDKQEIQKEDKQDEHRKDEKEDSSKDKKKKESDDLLNSFFISDIDRIINEWADSNIGKGLKEYITAISRNNYKKRIDVREPVGIQRCNEILFPINHPQGRWMSAHPLVYSQQVAVNEIWRKLKDSSGIFAVNGPPGTGKTTLLRDIVAAVVVERAKRIIELNGEGIFGAKKQKKLGNDTWISYYLIDDAILDSSIVVASANNGAVENVTLELPGIGAISESAMEKMRSIKVDYFSNLANKLLKKSKRKEDDEDTTEVPSAAKTWGLIAARLGRKRNRTDFANIVIWQNPEKNEESLKKTTEDSKLYPSENEGLVYHLEQIKSGKRKPLLTWQEAVKLFQDAIQREKSIRKNLINAVELPRRISDTQNDIQSKKQQILKTEEESSECLHFLKGLQAQLDSALKKYDELREQRQEIDSRLSIHYQRKPGLLLWITTWGKSHRTWLEEEQELKKDFRRAKEKEEKSKNLLKDIEKKYQDYKLRYENSTSILQCEKSHLTEMQNMLNEMETLLKEAKEKGYYFNFNTLTDNEAREKNVPWAVKEWHEAREDVFIAALAVHRALLECYPKQALQGLYLVNQWLSGSDMDKSSARTALGMLCLIVPVISTTFASVSKMFQYNKRESIGWLLIDEAGQAQPQQAIGAIWRSKRTIVVGDPNQLEPVVTIPETIEGGIANYYSVSKEWWPSNTSVQCLADNTNNIGTYIYLDGSFSDSKEGIWVGCPLRVHRRCNNPMFRISNEIAYDGMMIHGKRDEESDLPESCWIDVRSSSSSGHWIPDEGKAVSKIINVLTKKYSVKSDDIFLISPFRDCAKQLTSMARNLGLNQNKTGTVHTAQGKESDIVILVLGGDPQKPGAKQWASRKPNLLNVAVSRAKKRLYVVGNRDEWAKHRFFDILARNISVKTEFDFLLPTHME